MSQVLALLSRIPVFARVTLGLALALGLATLYVTGQDDRNPQMAANCKPARDLGASLAGASSGDVAAFQANLAPRKLPALAFQDGSGNGTSMANWRGKTVLLNLWATWCAPCRKEMPALDALQAEFGGSAFEVVAVNIDTRNLDKPRAWLSDNGITRLAYYADPEARIFQDLKRAGQAVGMPTTLLIDANGCNLGVLHGAADWASADAKRLIKVALGR